MAKETNAEFFMNNWEEHIPGMSVDDLRQWLSHTSPHHPNSNMVWLYDRLLMEIVIRRNPPPTPEPLACREAFEAWVSKNVHGFYIDRNERGVYQDMIVRIAWDSWEACWNQRIATVSRKEGV